MKTIDFHMQLFADMEELGMRPTMPIVNMVGDVLQKLGMVDKYRKLNKKYPPPKWEHRYVNGKRVKIRAKSLQNSKGSSISVGNSDAETNPDSYESVETAEISSDELDMVEKYENESTEASSPIVYVETAESSV